jgi:hypothetical protein
LEDEENSLFKDEGESVGKYDKNLKHMQIFF